MRMLVASSLLGVLALVTSVSADTWALPQKRKYYSPHKRYYLEVTPKKLESQLRYFEDKVKDKKMRALKKGVNDNRAKAAIYGRRSDGSYSKKVEFPLVNEVSPVSAVVSDLGDYVVTFDNWHSVGYGDDVVVIYRSDGTLIKKLSLEDLLTPGDIESLPRSVSSIWWGGEHYIDEHGGLLVLKVVANRKNSWDDGVKFHELKIKLASGLPLEPKRDLFPQPRVFGSVDANPAPETLAATRSEATCSSAEESFDSPDAVHVPSQQLYAKVKAHPFPPYPPIARAAHAEGTVTLELLVSRTGAVLCARSLSGHPLLRAAALAAVRNWKFDPIEVSGTPAKVISTIALTFKLEEKDMNPNNQTRN